MHLGATVWTAPAGQLPADGAVDVCVRPYDLAWSDAAGDDTLAVSVVDARWLGGRYRIEFSTGIDAVPFVTAEWSRSQMPAREPASGDAMHLRPNRLALFAAG